MGICQVPENFEIIMLSDLFFTMWHEAMENNINNILSLLEKDSNARVLDVGCGDGKDTLRYQKAVGTRMIYGMDGQQGRVVAARKRGIETEVADIEKKWPYPNASFDVVLSNQVIEHIHDVDHFISESFRVLRRGGTSIVSTENLASWHNIAALILGFQDFSHHLVKIRHVGNPLSPHFGKKTASWSRADHSGVDDSLYPHVKIMTYRSLRQAYEAYDFTFVAGRGSGYHPLFSMASKLASLLDPSHAHFITVKMRK